MSIIQRLNIYMEHTGLSSSQFADAAAIPRPSMSQILNGRNKKVSNELIEKLHVAFPNLNIVWLMFGEGPMETISNTQTSEAQNGEISIAGDTFHSDCKNISNTAESDSEPTIFLSSTKNREGLPKSAVKSAGTVPPGLFDTIQDPSTVKGDYSASSPVSGTDMAAESEDPAPYGKSPSGNKPNTARGLHAAGDYGVTVLCSTPEVAAHTYIPPTQRRGRGIPEGYSDIQDKQDKPATTVSDAPNASSEASRISERRIASIMVFYSDNSFQIFKPDGSPENSN